jgi:RNA-directed DNA polymerase
MTIGSAHTYIKKGVEKGLTTEFLNFIVESSLEQESSFRLYIHDLKHLCHYSGADHDYLRKLILREIFPYNSYKMKKRSGGHRFISSPFEDLKYLQKWINKYILANVQPHFRCFSYRPKISIYDCAKEHCGSKWLIKLDIENFFDSVSEIKVYNLFRELGHKPLLSFELARLCTIEPFSINKNMRAKWRSIDKVSQKYVFPRKHIKFWGKLPQGAPTSPSISNNVFRNVDEAFQSFAIKNHLTYTRYADDICFSTHQSTFCRDDAKKLIEYCAIELRKNGYASNKAKIRIIPPGVRKVVLGLNVNHELPKLTKAYKKKLECHVRGIEVFGAISHAAHKKFESVFNMLEHVLGLINHAKLVEYEYAAKLSSRFLVAKQQEGLI